MDTEDLPSDSESSDDDFVPKAEGTEVVSEEDSDEAVEDDMVKAASVGRKRRALPSKPRRPRTRNYTQPSDDEEPAIVEEETDETKKRADSLWADFLSDCGPVGKRPEAGVAVKQSFKPTAEKESKPVEKASNGVSSAGKENSEAVQPQEPPTFKEYEFAGEKVKVECKPGGKRGQARGGLASVLSHISSKKTKLSTLEKSKLDWERFKSDEGISEQLSTHNKGKQGYLERQDFLERADLRQFEVEKSFRAIQRANQMNQFP